MFNWSTDEEKKFEEFYRLYINLVKYIAYDILKDEDMVLDAVQEIFFKISKNYKKIYDKDFKDLKGFVVVVTRSVCKDIYRQKKRKVKKKRS